MSCLEIIESGLAASCQAMSGIGDSGQSYEHRIVAHAADLLFRTVRDEQDSGQAADDPILDTCAVGVVEIAPTGHEQLHCLAPAVAQPELLVRKSQNRVRHLCT